jgi:hypothetical protein
MLSFRYALALSLTVLVVGSCAAGATESASNLELGQHSDGSTGDGFEAPSGAGPTSPTQPVGGVGADQAPSGILLTETGLPNGTSWTAWASAQSSAEWGSTNQSTFSLEGAFSETPTTVAWGVGELPGFVPYPASGFVHLTGNVTDIGITFLPLSSRACSLLVTEHGLSPGTTWWATANDFTFFSNGPELYTVTSCSITSITFGSASTLQPDPTNASLWVLAEEGTALGVDFLPASTTASLESEAVLLAASLLGIGMAGGLYFGGRRRPPSEESLPSPV